MNQIPNEIFYIETNIKTKTRSTALGTKFDNLRCRVRSRRVRFGGHSCRYADRPSGAESDRLQHL